MIFPRQSYRRVRRICGWRFALSATLERRPSRPALRPGEAEQLNACARCKASDRLKARRRLRVLPAGDGALPPCRRSSVSRHAVLADGGCALQPCCRGLACRHAFGCTGLTSLKKFTRQIAPRAQGARPATGFKRDADCGFYPPATARCSLAADVQFPARVRLQWSDRT